MVAPMPTLCARCAMQGRTCCQGREIYVTPGDVRRIRAHTGEHQFVEWTRTADPDGDCPRHLLTGGESVFTAMAMPVEQAGHWHRQLYEEIITDDPEDRTDL